MTGDRTLGNSRVTKPTSSSSSAAATAAAMALRPSRVADALREFTQEELTHGKVTPPFKKQPKVGDASVDTNKELNARHFEANAALARELAPVQASLGPDYKFQEEPKPARTVEQVARSVFGDLLQIDTAVSKRLASQVALRDAVQRRPEHILNMVRRSNVEALMTHIAGKPAERACKNCRKGNGPWEGCVVIDGQLCGACSNCWYNASGSRCEFHDSKAPNGQKPNIYVSTPTPPPSALQPPLTYSFESPTRVTPGPTAIPAAIPQPGDPQIPVDPRLGMAPHMPIDLTNCGFPEAITPSVSQAIVSEATLDANQLSHGKRLVARIKVATDEVKRASKELHEAIAEWQAWSRTAEGAAELERNDQGLLQGVDMLTSDADE